MRLNAEERHAGRDATGDAQRVSLAKIAVLHRTSCDHPNPPFSVRRHHHATNENSGWVMPHITANCDGTCEPLLALSEADSRAGPGVLVDLAVSGEAILSAQRGRLGRWAASAIRVSAPGFSSGSPSVGLRVGEDTIFRDEARGFARSVPHPGVCWWNPLDPPTYPARRKPDAFLPLAVSPPEATEPVSCARTAARSPR